MKSDILHTRNNVNANCGLNGSYGVIFAIVTFVFSGNPMVAGGALIIGFLGLPRWFVGFKKKRRMNAFLEEFPNAVDVITRGIKAGLPLNDCLTIIATEAKEPVKTEFKRVLETQRMGVPMTEAILKLYRNVPLTEANFFGIVISIQQSAGGNLSDEQWDVDGCWAGCDARRVMTKVTAIRGDDCLMLVQRRVQVCEVFGDLGC